MSSAPVILHAGLKYQSPHIQLNKVIKTKKEEDRDTFSEGEHRNDNSVASIKYARVNKSIIYVPMH